MSEQMDLEELWQQVREKLIAGDINRSMWDAARAAKLLALEDDVLVIGLAPADMRHASYLTSTTNKPVVQEALEQVLGRRVDIEAVEGDTLDAWEREKERRVHRVERAQASIETLQAAAATEQIWEALYEEISEVFGSARERRFAINRARMLPGALRKVREAEERARAQDPEATNMHQQHINRAIERIAVLSELPATAVAIEHLRMQRRSK